MSWSAHNCPLLAKLNLLAIEIHYTSPKQVDACVIWWKHISGPSRILIYPTNHAESPDCTNLHLSRWSIRNTHSFTSPYQLLSRSWSCMNSQVQSLSACNLGWGNHQTLSWVPQGMLCSLLSFTFFIFTLFTFHLILLEGPGLKVEMLSPLSWWLEMIFFARVWNVAMCP